MVRAIVCGKCYTGDHHRIKKIKSFVKTKHLRFSQNVKDERGDIGGLRYFKGGVGGQKSEKKLVDVDGALRTKIEVMNAASGGTPSRRGTLYH